MYRNSIRKTLTEGALHTDREKHGEPSPLSTLGKETERKEEQNVPTSRLTPQAIPKV